MSGSLVDDSYVDAFREQRRIDPDVRAAVMAAMGLEPGDEPMAEEHVVVVRRGATLPFRGEVVLEDGTGLGRTERMPPDAPFGYRRLVADDGTERLLITGPGRCHLPRGRRG